MTRYLLSSHDGYGLGHVRRNSLIARAITAQDPTAEVVVVTGVAVRPQWLGADRIGVVNVRPLVKAADGSYRNDEVPFEVAIDERANVFAETVDEFRPDVVIVDRHPFGIGGELRPGLELARGHGAALVIGLRDILDEPTRVRQEFAGRGWEGVEDLFDAALVYGSRTFCDHQAEYGLPLEPIYCGWVVEQPRRVARDANLIAVTAGGGGDGTHIVELGIELARALPGRRTILVAGAYARALPAGQRLPSTVSMLRDAPGCSHLYSRAGGVVQMAGYNSTFESLAGGLRPILVPRRSPRREQAIRASRLSALGLADIADESAHADEIAWLLDRGRELRPGQLAEAGISIDGAATAAAFVRDTAHHRMLVGVAR